MAKGKIISAETLWPRMRIAESAVTPQKAVGLPVVTSAWTAQNSQGRSPSARISETAPRS